MMVKIRVEEETEIEDSTIYDITEEDADKSNDNDKNTTEVNAGQIISAALWEVTIPVAWIEKRITSL
jgi:hypothetical protein